MVGHCAGSLGLDVLAPHEAFGLHPLMSITRADAQFSGAGAAVAGSTPRALALARDLADALQMNAFEIADNDRAAYHAAASIASNFLVTLEDAAEVMLRTAGADRSILVPLVRVTLENWAAAGAPAALTGPIVRGDEATVARRARRRGRPGARTDRIVRRPLRPHPSDRSTSSRLAPRSPTQRRLRNGPHATSSAPAMPKLE